MDIGTTYSGYAFATKDDFKKDPLKIDVPHWFDVGFISSKTPTTVLIDKNEKFVAFGFEAETKYAELLENGEGKDYFYFQHFKMMLYDHAKTKVLV